MIPYIHFVLPTYGIMAALGFAAAFVLFCFRGKRAGFGFLKSVQLLVALLIGLAVGSRALFALTMIPSLIADFSVERLLHVIINGGFVFYGGLFGAVGAAALYCRIRKMDLSRTLNAIIPCFALFHCFGRIGCFLSGCCYGIPFPVGFVCHFDPDTIRFPVQLVEALCNLIIVIILLLLERKKPEADLFSVYLVIYPCCRFLLEFLRGDTVRGIWLGLSTSQWISIFVLIFVVVKNRHKIFKRRTSDNNKPDIS